MKKVFNFSFVAVVAVVIYGLSLTVSLTSCKDDPVINTDTCYGVDCLPADEIFEVDGQKFPKTNVDIDINGDGIANEDDNKEILGGSINVTKAKDDNGNTTDLYGANLPGSEAIIGEKVEDGVKLCYFDMEESCSEQGGLYSYETSVNTNTETLQTGSATVADLDGDDVVDWVAIVSDPDTIQSIAQTYSNNSEAILESVLESLVSEKIIIDGKPLVIKKPDTSTPDLNDSIEVDASFGDFLVGSELNTDNISTTEIETIVAEAIKDAIKDIVPTTSDAVDVVLLEQTIKNNINQGVIDLIIEKEVIVVASGTEKYLPDGVEITDVVEAAKETVGLEVGESVAQKTTDYVSEIVAEKILESIPASTSAATVAQGAPAKGLCPKGYHIPTDAEWMALEASLGMSPADLGRYGEDVTDRGADANIVNQMVTKLNMQFGGYASINGTFVQQGEVGVYWSSTAGTDKKGDYVWVREISVNYTGVVRYKHYEKSGLSIRCFADKK